MPSGDSTPSASGLDSRCSPRSWLTSGGPSSRRLVEYQNVSGRPALLSSKPTAFRVATDLRLSSGLSLFWAPETSYHHNRRGHNQRGLPGKRTTPILRAHPLVPALPPVTWPYAGREGGFP